MKYTRGKPRESERSKHLCHSLLMSGFEYYDSGGITPETYIMRHTKTNNLLLVDKKRARFRTMSVYVNNKRGITNTKIDDNSLALIIAHFKVCKVTTIFDNLFKGVD